MESNPRDSSSSSPSSSSSDYINMEVDSSLSHSISSKEFEFQSFSSSSDTGPAATSPADHLFFMGKLLPLQMVHKITPFEQESFRTPIFSPISNTPFESCNATPSDSRHVSGELNLEEYCLHEEYLSETKNLNKLIKKIPSSFGSKLKLGYLKSLFRKSSCSDKKLMERVEIKDDDLVGRSHRRSISGAFKRLTKGRTASFSCSSSKNLSKQVLKSGTSNLELENSIQAAIAHCKRSQQEFCSRRILADGLQENTSFTDEKIYQ